MMKIDRTKLTPGMLFELRCLRSTSPHRPGPMPIGKRSKLSFRALCRRGFASYRAMGWGQYGAYIKASGQDALAAAELAISKHGAVA